MAPPRVLFIRLGAIGDVVRTLPALRLVRERIPDAHLAWIVEERSLPVVAGHTDLNEVVLLERDALSGELSSPASFFDGVDRLGRLAARLRRSGFTHSLDFQGTLKSGLVAFAAGAERRIGYDRGSVKEGNHLFSNEKVVLPPPPVHRVLRNLALLGPLGIDPATAPPKASLPIGRGEREAADEALRRAGSSGGPFVFISAGSSARQAYKRYPPDRFREVVRLLRDAGVEVVIGQGPGEEELARRLLPEDGPRPALLPPTPLLVMAEVIRRARLFIGGDTGPMHVAWIQGVPVLALFASTDPALNAPWGPGHVVLDALADDRSSRPASRVAGGRATAPVPSPERGAEGSDRPRVASLFETLDPRDVAETALGMLSSSSDRFEARAGRAGAATLALPRS